MSAPYLEPATFISSSGHTDGLGRRELYFDRGTGAMLERLRVRAELAAYEVAIRERVATLAGIDDPRFSRTVAAERDAAGDLAVVSEFVAGTRLSDLLDLARDAAIVPGVDVALGYMLDALGAVGALHTMAGFAHGLIAPDRTMITPDGQVVFLDSAYAAIVDRLGLSRRRLWTEFGIASVPADGQPRIEPDGDLGQIALSAVMLVLGRAMEDADYPDNVPSLLVEVVEVAQIRGTTAFAGAFQRILQRMLPLPGRRPYASADEALNDLKQLLRREIGIDVCRQALVDFVEQVSDPEPTIVPDTPYEEIDESSDGEEPAYAGHSVEEASESDAPGEDANAIEFEVDLDDHVEPRAETSAEEEVYELALDIPPELNPFPLDIRRPPTPVAPVWSAPAIVEKDPKPEPVASEGAPEPAADLTVDTSRVSDLPSVARPDADPAAATDAPAVILEDAAAIDSSAVDEAPGGESELAPATVSAYDETEAPVSEAIGSTEEAADEPSYEHGAPEESTPAPSIEEPVAELQTAEPERHDAEPAFAALAAEAEEPDVQAVGATSRLEDDEAVAPAESVAPVGGASTDAPVEAPSAADEQRDPAPVTTVAATESAVRPLASSAEIAPTGPAAAVQPEEATEAETAKGLSRRKRHQHKSARARKDKLRSTAAPELAAKTAKPAEPPAPTPAPAPAAPAPPPAAKSGWLVPPERSAKFQPAFDGGATETVPPFQVPAAAPPEPVAPQAAMKSPSGWMPTPPAAPAPAVVSQPIVSYASVAPPAPAFPPLAATSAPMPRFGAQPAARPAAAPALAAGVDAVTRLSTVKVKAEPPAGYTPTTKPRRNATPMPPRAELTDYPQVFATSGSQDEGAGRAFPWKLAVAALLLVAAAIIGGRYLLHGGSLVKKPVDEAAQPAEADPPNPAPVAKGNTGQIVIRTEPSGVRVLLDGDAAGETPLTLNASAGRHVLSFETASGSVKRTVKVVTGKALNVDLPVFSGWVSVLAPFVVEAFEDGKSIGTSEGGRLALAPGHHKLTLHNADLGYSSDQAVDISPGSVSSISIDPKGQANLNAVPWAEVWIDGRKIGDTPIANYQVPLGSQEFVFKHPQFGERRVTAIVRANQAAAIAVDFTRP